MGNRTVIKRYRNRKLYNMDTSSYVTLNDVSDLVKSGRDVLVLESDTGEDLTQVTMAQVLLGEEKKVAKIPQRLLKGIKMSAGGSGILGDFYKKKVSTPFFSWCEDVEKRIHEIKNLHKTILDLEKRVKELETIVRRNCK